MELERKRILLSETIKMAILSVILMLLLVSQFLNINFVHVDLLFPVFSVLAVSLFLHTTYLIASWKNLSPRWMDLSLFLLDCIIISFLIYYIGNSRSLFLFLFLVNIILAGINFKKWGSFATALCTSLCFSMLLVFGPQLKGQTLLLVVGLNNTAFFVSAWLSAYLSEYFDRMGERIATISEDLKLLTDVNHLIRENMPTGFISTDNFGRINVVNEASKNILEIEELEGERIQKVIPDIDKKYNEMKSEFNEDFKKLGNVHFDYELVFEEKRKVLGFTVSDIYGSNSQIIGSMYIFADQTKMRQLEGEVRRKEKLAAVGQLAAGIAHEIRNPLTSMSGSIQFLSQTLTNLDDDEKRLMNIILKETDRLNGLITDFMEFVRAEPNVNDKVNVGQILTEVKEMIRFNNDLNHEVSLDLKVNHDRLLWGNANKLKQVFLNLVINAFHALENTMNPKILIITEYEKGLVRVRIKDNGCGMDDKVKSRLFEPFHTTKAKGTGLGLATVHKILENHNARVFVETEVNQGTEFIIEFTRLV